MLVIVGLIVLLLAVIVAISNGPNAKRRLANRYRDTLLEHQQVGAASGAS